MEQSLSAPLDLVGLCLVVVLAGLGLYRGLWWQAIRLVAVTLAVVAARMLGPQVAVRLHDIWPELSLRVGNGIAWGAVFLAALLAGSLLGLLGQRLLEAMQLGLANRLAGGVVGAVTGLCAHVVLVVLLCQLTPSSFLGQHVVGTYSERLYSAIGQRFPVVLAADAADEVDRALGEAPPATGRPPHRPAPPSEHGVVR
jgi:uncharacterized membrane protein required for colicin V production